MSNEIKVIDGKKYKLIKEEVITKELVVKRLNEGYYVFSSAKINEEFRRDLKAINFDLSYVNLRYANLREANLWEADLSYADLSYANLREANLREANLREANLSYANLSGAILNAIFLNTKVSEKQRKYICEETDLFKIIK